MRGKYKICNDFKDFVCKKGPKYFMNNNYIIGMTFYIYWVK